ncbi:MAG: 2-C-methyl-D-erythritol 4-phosphate cytidylyltransferase [Crocinitomicaceae bacterium]|nr:2-C-methyl-D-erythritol 4-phosphate cytidylyltransferase [Crocinitomicaceae bacterium]
MKKTIIITAAGEGKRMPSNLPKQFSNLNGKPILMHTIRRFYRINPDFEIILTLPEKHLKTWKKLCLDHDFQIPHHTVNGGEERFHSVKNALNFSTGDLIGVHDGVRPVISRKLVEELFAEAEKKGAVIPVIEINQSLRKIEGNNSLAVDRSEYRIVQTPQVFKADIIQKAYQITYQKDITDDATLVERVGHKIYMIEGDINNIKITFPRDMLLVEELLGQI